MKRPETSLPEDPGTRPPHHGDRTEALSGTPGSRLILGRYRLERRLGAGGFGVVWQAWDEKLEREVAVKVIPREGGSGERVEREARAAARLNHPGIVGIYELAADEHDIYLVSELVRGRTLAELLAGAAIADRDVARIGVALCDALGHAHERGVIHRDVKPQNVMVVAEPAAGAGFAKLADFGVAHVVSGDPLTRTGDVVGTLAYMAPEQAEGVRVTPACDVYSLALCLYEAWTGANPVRAAGAAATVRRMGRPLPSLAAARRDLPLDLCDVIDAALDPAPAHRPPPARLRTELALAEPHLEDAGGLVEPETLRRMGLPATQRHATLLTRILGGRDNRLPALEEAHPPDGAMPGEARRPATGSGLLGRAAPAQGPPARVPFLVARAAAGLAAAALVLGAVETAGPEPPVSAAALTVIVALGVAVLPRIGWLVAVAGMCAWLVSPDVDRQGTALLVAAAAAPTPLLLPRAGVLWSLPALAPLLGTVALAPVFVGVAALAPTAWRRAGLAGAGLLWLVLAEALTGTNLLFGVADGTLPRAEWEGSISAAASDALGPLVSGPVLAPAVMWAAFAAVLPLLARGRWLALDAAAAGLWVTGLALAHLALGDALATSTALDQPRGAVAGSVGAALLVLSVAQLVRPAEPLRARPAGAAWDYPASQP